MTASRLMGYVRKSRAGAALNVSISVDAFDQAERYSTQDGSEFVRMVISLDRLRDVLEENREVTGISQLLDDPIPRVPTVLDELDKKETLGRCARCDADCGGDPRDGSLPGERRTVGQYPAREVLLCPECVAVVDSPTYDGSEWDD